MEISRAIIKFLKFDTSSRILYKIFNVTIRRTIILSHGIRNPGTISGNVNGRRYLVGHHHGSGWRKVPEGGRWNPLGGKDKMEALYIASDGICNFLCQPSVLVYFYSWPSFDADETSNPAGSSYHLVLRPPSPSSYRDCTCSGVVLFPVLSSAHPPTNFIVIRRFVVRINEIRCETRVPSLLVLVNARGRPLKMKITERGISSRISPTNPRYRCSLIFRPLSLFPRSRIVRSSRSRIVFERVLHTVVLYISLGKCFAGIICRGGWKEGIRVTKFIPVFPPFARNTVLYIYI